jgi:hypothetical protein
MLRFGSKPMVLSEKEAVCFRNVAYCFKHFYDNGMMFLYMLLILTTVHVFI